MILLAIHPQALSCCCFNPSFPPLLAPLIAQFNSHSEKRGRTFRIEIELVNYNTIRVLHVEL